MNLAALAATPGVDTPYGRLSVERRGKAHFVCVTDFFGRKRIASRLSSEKTLFSSLCGQHPYSQKAIFDEIDRREEMAEMAQKREHDDQGRDFERAITAAVMSSPDGKEELFRRMGFHR